MALVVGCASAQAVSPQESIVIVESSQLIDITVPVSRLALRMPKAGFKRSAPSTPVGSTASPRYFKFEDKVRGIILSGWFESGQRFTGVKEPPVGSFEGEPLPHRNVSFDKLGSWDVVFYDVSFRSTITANLQAHLVQADTWIELHLSAYPDRSMADQRALLAETIRSIQIQELAASAVASPDELLKDFAPLISKVRGAIRYQIEQGKSCLPWASLAVDPNVTKTMVDFAFTPELVKQLGDVSAKAIGSRLAIVANKGPFILSAIGTCETDSSIGEGAAPNVITLILERRNGSAIKMRFPFEQSGTGQVSYINSKVSVAQTPPLVFIPPTP